MLLVRQPEDGGGGRGLGGPVPHEVGRVTRRIGRALPPVGADQGVHLAPGGGPRGQCAAAGHVRIVRMGVDGQGHARHLGQELGHASARRDASGAVVLVRSPTSRRKSSTPSNPL